MSEQTSIRWMGTASRLAAIGLLCVCASCARRASAREAHPGLAGDWVGYLDGGNGGGLLTVLRIEERGDDGYGVVVLSPMQTEAVFSGSMSATSGARLSFRFKELDAEYRAAIDSSGTALSGAWKQRGGKLPLELKKQDGPFVFSRPQEPKPPYGYGTVDLEFPGGSEGVKLSGTLSYPLKGKAKAGVVLISGSGAQDRNESLLGHKPFLVLADRLAKAGYAVLRYDDRGTAKSTGDFAAATTYDFLADAGAALETLRARKEVGAVSCGVVGHSEGGLIATLLAGDPDLLGAAGAPGTKTDVDFAVALAGPAFPGDELLHLQSKAILESQGKGGLAVQAARMANEKIYGIVKAEPLGPEMRKKLKAAFLSMGVLGKNADIQIGSVSTPWFKTFLEIDPAPSARSVRAPFLALYGDKDVQVPSPENPDKMRADLEAAGRPDSKVVVLAGLNHLFQKAEKGTLAEYGMIDETMNEKALETLVAWLDGLRR